MNLSLFDAVETDRHECSPKARGAYYTPEVVARTLVQWVVRSPGDRLLDPSSGDGQFLALHRNSVGVENTPSAVAVSAARAPWARIHADDFFSWAKGTNERFDCVAGNPPFVRYQRFSGTTRARSLALCATLGVKFSALASSWAPFLVAASSLLKPGGRLGFVVPAEIGHAPYAIPLCKYLATRFGRVAIVAIRETIFPELSQDVWLLYGEGYGERTERLELCMWEEFTATSSPPRSTRLISLNEWSEWNFRLRPFLLSNDCLETYRRLGAQSQRFGELATVGIGYVTGANDFFHLRPSIAERLEIPSQYLLPTVRNSKSLPREDVSARTVAQWMKRDDPCLLLRIPPSDKVEGKLLRYLNSPEAHEARRAYKCRVRDPWYSVPHVTMPDAFLSYMCNTGPLLVANSAKCACTNSVHAVKLLNGARVSGLQRVWHSPLTQFSCELEGHPLGGGMLKLEPSEAKQVRLLKPNSRLSKKDEQMLIEGLQHLRRWRHHE